VSSFSKSSAPKELFWLTERKERKREKKKIFELLKGEDTHKKKTLNGFNSKLCSSVKTNKIFEKLQNLNFFQNLKTKKISLKT